MVLQKRNEIDLTVRYAIDLVITNRGHFLPATILQQSAKAHLKHTQDLISH